MSLHDDYARLTPLEIAFPDRAVVDELAAAVAAESGQRGVDDTAPDVFLTTLAVAELVRKLGSREDAPESRVPLGLLAFHCVHFVRAGCPLYLLGTAAVRQLVAAAPEVAAVPSLRLAPSGYLQLPQHLVWTEAVAGGAPESIDGLFWTFSASGMVHALPISGVRPDRPGFGTLALPAAPWSDAPLWLEADARESGDDFSSTLPGGDLDELYSIRTAGEVLKLLVRFFAHAAAAPGSLQVKRPRPIGDVPEEAHGGPRPSVLTYTRVTLGDGGALG